MRIIAGRFKGLPIPPALKGTRPTTDRTKEAIFSHLSSWNMLDGVSVLDLYAGTGALGLESLSRGAGSLTAVESSRRAASLVSKTLGLMRSSPSWGEGIQARVLPMTVEHFLSAAADETFDLIFMDPPYAVDSRDCDSVLASLVSTGSAGPGTVIVLERSARSASPRPPAGWSVTETRTYGETAVHYLEAEGGKGPEAGEGGQD